MPPRLARLLAIVAAVVLVIGAFALRGSLSGDDDEEGVTTGSGSGSGSASGTEPREPDDGPFTVICDDDLGDVCDAVGRLDGVDDIEVLRADEALDRLARSADKEGALSADLWITVDPWPSMLDAPGVSQGVRTGGAPLALASSRPAILAYPGDHAGCTTEPTWSCLADLAPTVNIGIPTVGTATGTVLLGHASAGLVGRTDFGANVVTDDPAITDALDALLDSAVPAPTAEQVNTLVVRRGAYTAAATTRGLAAAASKTPSGIGSNLTVSVLEPEGLLGVVAAPLGPRGADVLDSLREGLRGQDVRAALVEAGWTGNPHRSSGLPDPDVIYALNEEFD